MYSNDGCYNCPEKERLGYCPLEKKMTLKKKK